MAAMAAPAWVCRISRITNANGPSAYYKNPSRNRLTPGTASRRPVPAAALTACQRRSPPHQRRMRLTCHVFASSCGLFPGRLVASAVGVCVCLAFIHSLLFRGRMQRPPFQYHQGLMPRYPLKQNCNTDYSLQPSIVNLA